MIARSDRHALSTLLELVRNPRKRPAQEVVGYDWSRLPGIRALALSELDPLVGEYQQATIIERDNRQFVYLGSGTGGADHTTVLNWDPTERKILWNHQLNSPVEERWTHKGVLRKPMNGVRYLVRWPVAGTSPGRVFLVTSFIAVG